MQKFYFFSFCIFFILMLFQSCTVFQNTAKQELSDGFYTKKSNTGKTKIFVDVTPEDIRIYPTLKSANSLDIDSSKSFDRFLPELKTQEKIDFSLSKKSWDIDFLTIPIKYRFAEKNVPAQLNANINGALYLGYRTDSYKIKYHKNPLKMAVQKTDHIGYSFGVFSGFGNTLVSPTNTGNFQEKEYDGIVWSKGIAAIMGINNFSVGLTLGFDNLMDQNKKIWTYENKAWIGLAFGLNLN